MTTTTISKKATTTGWIICTIAALFYCYGYLLRIEPSVMVDELMQTFQINSAKLGMLSAFFYFFYTPMQVISGILFDLYGSRKILTLAVVACTLGSYMFGATDSVIIASLGRALIGFGSAFSFIAVIKLSAVWLPQRFFAFFVGLATAVSMIGAMTVDIVLGPLVHSIGWKQTIHFGTIAGVLLIPLIWFIIKDKPAEQTKGKALAKEKPQYRKIFTGFLKILQNRQMWLIGSIGLIMYLSLSVFAELWGIPFLSTAHDLSRHEASTANSMVFLGWLIGGPLVGLISDLGGSRKIPILIGCFFSTILISIIIYMPQISITTLHVLLILFGIFSSFEVLCFAVSSENNPKPMVATATAFTNTLIMLGGMIFQPLIGKLLDVFWSGQMLDGNRIYSVTDNQLALSILPIAFLIGFVLTFFLKETHGKKASE